MDDNRLKIDFGDGVSALDRAMRSITMAADGAIQRLTSLGWSRKSVNLEIPTGDPLPCWITLRKKRVYEIGMDANSEGNIVIHGKWITEIPPRGIIDIIMRR